MQVKVLLTLARIKQLQSSDPRIIEVHACVLIWGDALESSEHEAHQLVAGERFSGAGGEVVFFSGLA